MAAPLLRLVGYVAMPWSSFEIDEWAAYMKSGGSGFAEMISTGALIEMQAS